MAIQQVNAEATLGSPSSLLELFELDTRFIASNGQRLFFHAGVNGLFKPIVFNGISYDPFPVQVTGMEIPGNTNLPRPKVKASNINGVLSALLLTEGDLVGAKFVRRRVFARFIDNVNFVNNVNPFGTPDPTAAYDDEIFYVNRKVSENQEYVELECVSPLEIDNLQLPYRKALGVVCSFRYRDPETCAYTSTNVVSDRFGRTFLGDSPSGYGFTSITYRGVWDSGVNYQTGDSVMLTSINDFSYGQTFFYVCNTPSTSGSTNNPQFNVTNWISDACSHNCLGCKQHYPSGQLPAGFFPSLARNAYEA